MSSQLLDPPLVEPAVVPDTFVSGLAEIERLGPNVRFTFYANGKDTAHEPVRNVVARIVISVEDYMLLRQQTTAFLATICDILNQIPMMVH